MMDINSIIEMMEKLKKDFVVCNHNPCLHLDFDDIIEQLRKMSDWQPIETAPKDGTSVLLLTAYGIIEGFWSDKLWTQDVCESNYDMASAVISCKPTHWMPLLPQPSKAL